MKLCVSLRDPAPKDLRSGNLRSEPRWERQALEASLNNPLTTEVYTAGRSWEGSHPKYKGSISRTNSKDTILLLQDWNDNVFGGSRFKAAFVNVFAGPWDNQVDEVKRRYNEMGSHLYLTMGFPVMYRNELGLEPGRPDLHLHQTTSHLEKFVPRENILLLPVPGAPYVENSNNFDKQKLLWAQRMIFVSQMAESPTLVWSLEQLAKDSDLSLDILTGWKKNEVKDFINGHVVRNLDLQEAFWSHSELAPFKHLQSQVRFHLEKPWNEVLQLYQDAKLYTTYGRGFGGPPIEAGMHGVPFVVAGKTGALCDCPNYLWVSSASHTKDNEVGARELLSKLMVDREYYDLVADSYREYIRDTYSFDAFNRNFNSHLSDKGLL